MKMPFGKYAGTPVENLPSPYLWWLSGADWLREPLKTAIEEERERRLFDQRAPRVINAQLVGEIVTAERREGLADAR